MFLAGTHSCRLALLHGIAAERYAIGDHAVADRRQDRRRYARLRLCHEITDPLKEGHGGLRGRRRPGARPTKVLNGMAMPRQALSGAIGRVALVERLEERNGRGHNGD